MKRLLTWLRSPGESLRHRVLHGGIWVTLLNISDRSLRILRLVILARLLVPSDFGLMGIAMLTMAVMSQLANLGIDPALIQREEDNIDPYLDTVWFMKIFRGAGLFILLFITAPIFATFFGEPRAQPVLRVLGIGMVLTGLVNPSIVYFRKDLEFHKQFIYKITGTVVDFIVAIGAALVLQNVWALVYGVLSGRVTRLLVSYILSDYRPSIGFNRDAALRVLDFGKWIWATGLITFIATSGDDAFVGWYLTAASLGFYQMAFRLSNSPATEVTHVISSITFPAYSKLQHDQEALQNAFLKTIRVIFVIVVPMATGIIMIAPKFTQILLGEQWMPMVPVMQIMAIAGLIRAIAATGGSLFRGYGIPEWDFRMNALRAGGIILTIWPLTNLLGITGAAISITFGIGLTLPLWLYKTVDITGLPVANYGKSLLTPLIGAAIMTGPVLLTLGPSVWRLAGAVLVGILVYFAAIYFLYKFQSKNPIDDVIALVNGRET